MTKDEGDDKAAIGKRNFEADTADDELPPLNNGNPRAEVERAAALRKLDQTIVQRLLEHLGVTLEQLEKRADEDFALAKEESAARLKGVRQLRQRRIEKRQPLRDQVESEFGHSVDNQVTP